MPKKSEPRTRVSVMFSRRFDSKSRNGRIWAWIKNKYPDNKWHDTLLELAYIFFSAQMEAERTIQDRIVQREAIADFSALLAKTIEQEPFPDDGDRIDPVPKLKPAIILDDDDDGFDFEEEDD